MLRIALAIALLGGTAAAQQCANVMPWSLTGTYALSYQGTLAFPPAPGSSTPVLLPGVLLGIVTYDHTGTLGGTATLAVGGQMADYEVVGGSIKLNPDCSGTATIQVVPSGAPPGTPAGTEIDKIIYLPGEHKFLTMQHQLAMPAIPMVLGTWTRIDLWPSAGTRSFGDTK